MQSKIMHVVDESPMIVMWFLVYNCAEEEQPSMASPLPSMIERERVI